MSQSKAEQRGVTYAGNCLHQAVSQHDRGHCSLHQQQLSTALLLCCSAHPASSHKHKDAAGKAFRAEGVSGVMCFSLIQRIHPEMCSERACWGRRLGGMIEVCSIVTSSSWGLIMRLVPIRQNSKHIQSVLWQAPRLSFPDFPQPGGTCSALVSHLPGHLFDQP